MDKDAPKTSLEELQTKIEEVTSFYEEETNRLSAKSMAQLNEKAQRILQLEQEIKEFQTLRDVLTSLLKPSIEEIIDQSGKNVQSGNSVTTAFPEADIVKNLPSYEQKIYKYLSSHRDIAFTKYQIATALKIGPKSSRYSTALKRLKKLKLIDESKGGLRIHD